MAMTEEAGEYFILQCGRKGMALMYSLPNLSIRDRWLAARPFSKQPPSPVRATIQPGYEKADVIPFYDTPQIMSDAFADVLRNAGVDNVDFYDAVLVDEKGTVLHKGYKAYNIISAVSAADVQKTRFSPDSENLLIDAAIDKLAIDPKKARGLLMFRLAENVGTIVVHARVARAIEAANFDAVEVVAPEDFSTL
jgi:hypothetical protein